MSEWWTYHLSDLLLFSARTYNRLFELANAAIWPAQIVAAASGLAILFLLRRGRGRRTPRSSRGICAILAAAWLWSGVAFLALRYAAINWSALPFAWAFGAEAVFLLALGVIGGRLDFAPRGGTTRDRAGRAGLALFLFALAAQPLLGALAGRGWKGLALFGLTPDATAVGTLGLLLVARVRGRWLLLLVPTLWCLYTGVFLLAMKAPDFWVPPAAAAAAVALASVQARSRRRGSASPAPGIS